MPTEGLTYTQYVSSLTNPQAVQYMLNLETAVNNGEISQYEFSQAVESVTGKTIKPHRAYNGDILGYTLETVETATTSNSVNSNASTVSRGTVAKPVSSTVNQGGKAVIQGLRGVGTKVFTGAALVGTAATCVSVGITLGKTIDSTLYNANPDFWNNIGLSSLNPETWNSITSGDDSMGAKLLNFLFGFDDDGNSQAYMDANALAYMAYALNNAGVFAQGETYIDPESITDLSLNTPIYKSITNINKPAVDVYPNAGWTYVSDLLGVTQTATRTLYWYVFSDSIVNDISFNTFMHGNLCNIVIARNSAARSPMCLYAIYDDGGTVKNYISYSFNGITASYNHNGDVAYYDSMPMSFNSTAILGFNSADNYTNMNKVAWSLIYGDSISSESIPGINDQSGATIPNFEGLTESDYLPYLQQTYPDLFDNAITYPVIQDDGTVKNYTYVPVAFPDINTRTDTEPTSGDATQTNTEISPSTSSQELIDTLTQILTNPMPRTEEQLDNDTPPENPTETGEGSSPVPIVPVGSASALWKIYHPTQAEIDSFGSWLWSSDFIDQILKIFNNPMEAVIGLHKVYATPIDAGTATIKVGYLDSQVPSAYIEQQYITVSCGSIDLSEQFGNVFDYSPYTDVQLYLPFVGIVPLNVAEVMRSTISIEYGVDVITGACLAMVEISRDNNSAILYQYSGNCAVQYPISSGSYMGIVTSIISVAGGVAATVASGGAAAPLALGAASGLLGAHTSVQHSGGFSGNAGAMGGKIPYLIISRPQTKVAPNAESMQGYPTNNYVLIGDCSGYVKADTAHVINVNATDEELTEINNLLLSGIII